MTKQSKKKIKDSLDKVEKWVESHGYKGYEPFDGLSSKLYPLTFKNNLLQRILQQSVRQSPINLRPILGVKPQESTKGNGYMASGYLTLYKLTGSSQYKDKAVILLDWLDKNKAHNYKYHSWGNHFNFTSRTGKLPKFEPIIVWTSLIGQTYLDAYLILNEKKYLEIACSICRWITDLPREETTNGICLSYVHFIQRSIHNSNMLGAAMLARTSKYTQNFEWRQIASQAMKYSCSNQLANGAWFYAQSTNAHWIDNFHTGYNLDSLKYYIESTGDTEFEENLHRGFHYYKTHFFTRDGKPQYYHNRLYPIDSQCASQSIETLANFAEFDKTSLNLALKVANWTIENMQDPDGHFYYRQYPLIKAKTPMMHWAQATTYKALALLISKMD